MDIVLSIIGLLVLLPFFPFVAILIKLDSSGPIFFRQERIGKNFSRFTIYKFRTMLENADKKGTLITAGGDNRITKVGGFLRRYKIDELPQLFNVLRGDMSFVGPRPEVSKYVELFETEYRKLLTVRPGITDLASLRYSNEEAILGKSNALEELYVSTILPEKIKLSSHYVDNHSLMTDMRLILMTVLKAFHINKDNAKK
jgi:lipopolysaccharide/colanic/teichoic acid biosynthesis glycosyltransferase